MECIGPSKKDIYLVRLNKRKERVNFYRLASLEMRRNGIGNSGSLCANGRWRKPRWSGQWEERIFNRLTGHLPSVVKGPKGLSFSQQFSFLLRSHQPMILSPPLDINLLMGRDAYSPLNPQHLLWCPACNSSSLNISCNQERRVVVRYSGSRQE